MMRWTEANVTTYLSWIWRKVQWVTIYLNSLILWFFKQSPEWRWPLLNTGDCLSLFIRTFTMVQLKQSSFNDVAQKVIYRGTRFMMQFPARLIVIHNRMECSLDKAEEVSHFLDTLNLEWLLVRHTNKLYTKDGPTTFKFLYRIDILTALLFCYMNLFKSNLAILWPILETLRGIILISPC